MKSIKGGSTVFPECCQKMQYSGNILQNYTLPWDRPNNLDSDCGVLVNRNTWGHTKCEAGQGHACMCQSNTRARLNLKGLCPGSAIDQYFQPMNDRVDKTKLRMQGLRRDKTQKDVTFRGSTRKK